MASSFPGSCFAKCHGEGKQVVRVRAHGEMLQIYRPSTWTQCGCAGSFGFGRHEAFFTPEAARDAPLHPSSACSGCGARWIFPATRRVSLTLKVEAGHAEGSTSGTAGDRRCGKRSSFSQSVPSKGLPKKDLCQGPSQSKSLLASSTSSAKTDHFVLVTCRWPWLGSAGSRPAGWMGVGKGKTCFTCFVLTVIRQATEARCSVKPDPFSLEMLSTRPRPWPRHDRRDPPADRHKDLDDSPGLLYRILPLVRATWEA